ncbi:hypothetical protein LWC34_52580 [Kibdelosporangium philippinense]|uniref:Secreted protein n=1 Tax=Kibdelosporangium philippinense TaxID=211113 RepID=A0ABS8ZUM6_9PSEU|nr:hypothetical protein [Kibdelosporangium philippinense]MCE7011393.1 hypothetical protein [Kibdelosporangium philippinense]
MSTGAIIVIIVVVVLVAAAAVFFLMPQMRSQRLRRRFGSSEYDRVVSSNGDDKRAAEKELADRERRHSEYDLHALTPEQHERYRVEWTRIQEHFVEAPVEAVAEADRLVNVVVADIGYPAEGYDRQIADLSVEHGGAVEHYRSAHDVQTRSDASTDDLRKAMISYRKVLDDLLDHRPRKAVQRA